MRIEPVEGAVALDVIPEAGDLATTFVKLLRRLGSGEKTTMRYPRDTAGVRAYYRNEAVRDREFNELARLAVEG